MLGMPFFFLGGPEYHGLRSFKALWNLGHVVFFFLASLLFCKLLRYRFGKVSGPATQISVFLLVLVTGGAVEGLQMSFDGRSPDIHDILRNQLGCLIALAFFDFGKRRSDRVILLPFRIAVVMLVVAAVYPLSRAVIDERIAASQFPLLSDFETPFEIDRWRDEKLLRVYKGIARHGSHSLKVQLTTDRYSGVSLFHFPGNWRSFSTLHISVFYPEEGELKLACRVHDFNHNNLYTDRFNRAFMLKSGWNDLLIPLADIEHAPVNRLLHMDRIENVKLFVAGQDKERVIYIDSVYLGR